MDFCKFFCRKTSTNSFFSPYFQMRQTHANISVSKPCLWVRQTYFNIVFWWHHLWKCLYIKVCKIIQMKLLFRGFRYTISVYVNKVQERVEKKTWANFHWKPLERMNILFRNPPLLDLLYLIFFCCWRKFVCVPKRRKKSKLN